MVPQPGRAGADGDHADGVAGRVVEVAGDPGALLGDGEESLTLSVPLGAQGAVPELGDLLAPQAGSLASEPGSGPGKAGVQQLACGESSLSDGATTEVCHQQPDDGGGDAPRPRSPRAAARGEQVERGG